MRPSGAVLDFKTGRNVIFRDSTIDLRGVDRTKWPKAGQILVDGVEGHQETNIRVL